MMYTVLRYGRYMWALPATLIGVLLAGLALRRGHVQIVDGVIEACGPWIEWVLTHCIPLDGGAAAITFGHVVVARDRRALDATRAHERTHVRQYERWGAFFLPAYVIASAYAAARGGHYYLDNAFEREAAEQE